MTQRVKEGHLWMLAYGSNMCDAVLIQRRAIPVVDSTRARVPGWTLVFNVPGIPLIEPAFANIEPAPDDDLHGVLRLIPACELARLDAMEGGGKAYEKVQLQALTYDGHTVPALAYRALQNRPGRPSRRYLDLLLQGARHHALDPAWIERLATTPVAHTPPFSAHIVAAVEWGFRHKLPLMSLFDALWWLLDRLPQRRDPE